MASFAMRGSDAECWIVRPCASPFLHYSGRLLGAAVFISGTVAGGFAAAGAWPVLPFAGLEIIALWLALRHLEHHAGDYEKIACHDGRLVVETATAGRIERHEFHPYWARLRIRKPPDGTSCRLFLGSHGREVEIGRRLSGEQKRALAGELKKQLGV